MRVSPNRICCGIVASSIQSERIDCQSDVHANEPETSSGTYGSARSSLSDKIRSYVADKHGGGPSIGETVQSFVNRIFVDLVDEMKKTIESYAFPHSNTAEYIKPRTIIRYAREADELNRTKRAETFYSDLISTADAKCNPNYWLSYASFRSRRLDFDTALECVKEVLLVDDGHRIGLFAYAAIQLTVRVNNYSGEIALKSLIMSHGDISEAYALLGVHYSSLKMHRASYNMLQMAKSSVGKDELIEKNSVICANLMSWQPIGHNNDPLIKCAILLLELELVKLASQCLNAVKHRCELYHYYMAVCEYKNDNHLSSLKYLKNQKLIGKHRKAADALTRLNAMAVVESSSDGVGAGNVPDDGDADDEAPREQLHLVYYKAAARRHENGRYAEAAEICRRIVNVTPESCTLLARCSIEMGDLEAAEDALTEANIMDIKNEEVWAYLTEVNVKMGNVDEAKVCYERAFKLGLELKKKKYIDRLFQKQIDKFK